MHCDVDRHLSKAFLLAKFHASLGMYIEAKLSNDGFEYKIRIEKPLSYVDAHGMLRECYIRVSEGVEFTVVQYKCCWGLPIIVCSIANCPLCTHI